MHIVEQHPGDLSRLEDLIAAERNADQRDRYRIALLALRALEKEQIAALLGVAKSTVEHWAYRYRDDGIGALTPRRRGSDRGDRCRPLPAEKSAAGGC